MRFVFVYVMPLCEGKRLFEASKPAEGVAGHFEFTLNGRYRLGLDTGGEATWMMTDSVAPGGYHVAEGKRVFSYHKEVIYPFLGILETDKAVVETMHIGNGIQWKELLPLVDTPQAGTYGVDIGILGASYNSTFAQANPVLTIVPMKNVYRIHADETIKTYPGRCAILPISERGLKHGRWMIEQVTMRLPSGHYTYLDFDIDTGFPHLAMPEPMWKHFHKSMLMQGATVLPSPADGVYRYSNCRRSNVPSVSYGFEKQDLEFKIPAAAFTTFFDYDGSCEMYIMVHDAGMYGGKAISFMGVPVLKSVITQLNRRDKTVSFCPLP